MLRRVFPDCFDNLYRGHPLGRWLLYPITFVNVGIGLATIFRADSGAAADGIPLDRYVGGGAAAVISAVALLGLAKVLMGLLAVLSLARYRSMIPLIYLLLVTDVLAHKAIGAMKPMTYLGGASAGYVVPVLIALSLAGLVLSLVGGRYAEARSAA